MPHTLNHHAARFFKGARYNAVRGIRPLGLFVLALIAFTGAACATLGTGTRTVIRHQSRDAFLQQTYPHLVVTDASAMSAGQVIYFNDRGNAETNADMARARLRGFRAFMEEKYGDPDYVPLVLQATVRDRTVVPTFSPVDYRKHLASMLLADTDVSLAERQRRFTLLVHQPDLYDSTTIHRYVAGIPAYRYYPRVSVDFGSRLRAASPSDRISFLLIVVQLKLDEPAESSRSHDDAGLEQMRFLDFAPKAADFVDFTRGQFTQAFQASAGALARVVPAASDASEDSPGMQHSMGWTPSAGFSESYVTNLADAIERRSTGLLNNHTFYAAFRSLREVRIGGTYNLDLMLEVPSTKGGQTESGGVVSHHWRPIADEVRADVYMIGVVRHVHDRGYIRSFWGLSKILEPENDDVYEQVVVKKVSDVLLWKSKSLDWVASAGSASRCVVEVFTNRTDATFVATSPRDDVVSVGRGVRAVLRVPETDAGCAATVRFVPIVQVRSDGTAVEFTVPQDEVYVEFAPEATKRVVGVYRKPAA